MPEGQALHTTRRCRLCGQPIYLAVIKSSGRRIPIDPVRADDDDTRANVAVEGDHLGSVFARVLSAAEPLRAHERRHHTHFATCPRQMDVARRRRRRRT
jgi:hypothetical protein